MNQYKLFHSHQTGKKCRKLINVKKTSRKIFFFRFPNLDTMAANKAQIKLYVEEL